MYLRNNSFFGETIKYLLYHSSVFFKSNDLEISSNKGVASRSLAHTPSDCKNLCCWVYISPRTVLIFSKNFLSSRFDAIEEKNILNLSCLEVRIMPQ